MWVFSLLLACRGGDCPVYDADYDGFGAQEGDCDDHNNTVYPRATEICDGVDNDCNDVNSSLNTRDRDGDGWTTCDNDCDDSNLNLNLDPLIEHLCTRRLVQVHS